MTACNATTTEWILAVIGAAAVCNAAAYNMKTEIFKLKIVYNSSANKNVKWLWKHTYIYIPTDKKTDRETKRIFKINDDILTSTLAPLPL